MAVFLGLSDRRLSVLAGCSTSVGVEWRAALGPKNFLGRRRPVPWRGSERGHGMRRQEWNKPSCLPSIAVP